MKNGTYKIVEGEVSNLKPMPKNGHIREEFSVKNIHFSTISLKDNKYTMFFNMTKYYGSPIQKNGQKVKIYYLESKPEKLCFPLLPRCIEFGDETVNKIIKLWVDTN